MYKNKDSVYSQMLLLAMEADKNERKETRK